MRLLGMHKCFRLNESLSSAMRLYRYRYFECSFQKWKLASKGFQHHSPNRYWDLALKTRNARFEASYANSRHYCNSAVPLNKCKQKDLKGEFPLRPDPVALQHGWWEWWEAQGFFKPENSPFVQKSDPKIFSMVMPPPNVTGDLHLGHALTTAIQDSLVRWHQMRGDRVVWVPGLDHAGIATQVVVEKKLLQEKGLSRHQLAPEEFLQRVHSWATEKEKIIYQQLRALGASFDSSKKLYTLDERMCSAVTKAFVQLHNDGLIYRQKKLVNWCCHLQTTISDIEVKYMQVFKEGKLRIPSEQEPIEIGVIETFSYPVLDLDECVQIATTRLETMLGDVAVAVHPTDSRYHHLIGRFVVHPLTGDKLPIIADEFVDPKFETGAVKITPSVALPDFELAERHGLPLFDVFDDSGKIQVPVQPFQGLSRYQAKLAIRNTLQEKGLYHSKKSHRVSLSICSRSGDLLVLRMKPQWFLKTSDMNKEALEVVKVGRLKLTPACHVGTWKKWLQTRAQDWCISRQINWGHRIPAYRIITSGDEVERWVAAESVEAATKLAAEKMKLDPSEFTIEQDRDVFDTWFSSALFPLVAFGWPEKTESFNQCYPLSLMETGDDILFFWVSRMVMLCNYFTGQIPFKEVLLHGMVRDSGGKKMSKSAGNVIDPMDIMSGISLEDLDRKLAINHEEGLMSDIELKSAQKRLKDNFPKGLPQCGADGLRFALLSHNVQNAVIPFDVNYVTACHHFSNKIWQGVRFLLLTFEKHSLSLQAIKNLDEPLGVTDRWILSRLAHMIRDCNKGFSSYNFELVTSSLYKFWVKEYCDVYVECAKHRSEVNIQKDVEVVCNILSFCTHTFLRACTPIMPFLCEELYHRLMHLWGSEAPPSVMLALYPKDEQLEHWCDKTLDEGVPQVMSIVRALRALKSECGMVSFPKAAIVCDEDTKDAFSSFMDMIRLVARLESVTFTDVAEPTDYWVSVMVPEPQLTIALFLENSERKASYLLKRKNRMELKLQHLDKKMKEKQPSRKTLEKLLQEKETLEEELRNTIQDQQRLT